MKKVFIAFVLAVVMTGCSSMLQEVQPIIEDLQDGEYDSAVALMDAELQTTWAEAQGPIVQGLDVGMLTHYSGEYDRSNNALTAAETEIWNEYTESLAASAATYLVNDNAKAYPGERYEDIYLNIFKSLNYYQLGSDDSAMVEIRRAMEKIDELKRVYEITSGNLYEASNVSEAGFIDGNPDLETEFISSALAMYLGMVYSRGMGDSNSFDYCRQMVDSSYSAQRGIYYFDEPDFLSGEFYDYEAGKARLNIISFSGLAPSKEEYAEYYQVSPVSQLKYTYPILKRFESGIVGVRVHIPSIGFSEDLELVEDFDTVIEDIFAVRQEEARQKAYMRTVAKSAGVSIAAEAFENNGDVSSDISIQASAVFVLTKLAETSESADVRGAHFFPSKAWGYGVTLDEGTYDIVVEFLDGRGNVVERITENNFEVRADKANLVEAFCLR